MKLNKDKWQSDFEKQLDIAEKKQISIVKRYYKSEYNKGINSFISEGQTNFQLLFDTKDLLKIYRELYSDIGMRFAKWYANNYQKYLTKNLDPTQLDIWQNSFASFGSAVGAQRVTLVSGTAKNNLIRITQQLMSDPEFMTLGAVERGRILRNQFNTLFKISNPNVWFVLKRRRRLTLRQWNPQQQYFQRNKCKKNGLQVLTTEREAHIPKPTAKSLWQTTLFLLAALK